MSLNFSGFGGSVGLLPSHNATVSETLKKQVPNKNAVEAAILDRDCTLNHRRPLRVEGSKTDSWKEVSKRDGGLLRRGVLREGVLEGLRRQKHATPFACALKHGPQVNLILLTLSAETH